MRLRFAPSPNGPLHLGHAFSALENARLARAHRGTLLLRMEDIDTTRCTPEFEQAIIDDLTWLEVEWQRPILRQSNRFDAYRAAANTLGEMGLIYPCFDTRGEIARTVAEREKNGRSWPRDPDGAPFYPGLHKGLKQQEIDSRIKAGEPYAVRLDMAAALTRLGIDHVSWNESGAGPDGETGMVKANPGIWGDAVLIRKDTPASYHLACVIDDAFQIITHVVRGRDLFHATALHRLLQMLLDLPEPDYHHHRLIYDKESEKLSKSTGSSGLAALRAAGNSAAEVRAMVGHQRVSTGFKT